MLIFKRTILLILFALIVYYVPWVTIVNANHCPSTDFTCQIEELQREIDTLKPAHESNQKELANLRKQLADIKARIATLTGQVNKLAIDIDAREEDLGVQEELLEKRVHEFYIRSRQYSPVLVFFASSNATELARELMLRSQAAAEDKRVITELAEKLIQLKTDKETLEKSRTGLTSAQKQIDSKATFLAGEVAKTESYLSALSSKQQSILAARSGQFTASIGDSELADDYNASIKGFRESAPSGSFAVFSFGAYTHRKGMSQYGARGRAQSGQNYKQILQAYYGKEPVNKDTGGDINVSGYGAMNFEEKYLYGIAEMPSSWNAEALKAQAVAARTYAYRYKVEGKSICTTEACQVFSKSKSDNSPQAWKDAVNSTKGQVLEDVVTYYASTHGVFSLTSGWDTTDGGGGSNFVDKSFEKVGGSPWVYKAWYTQGYSPSSDKCGRANPWLNGAELADIINAARFRDDRVTPISSCWGGNPYSHEELRSKSNGPSNVTSVTVNQGNGSTNEVVFQTDIGEIRLSGGDFKTAFNIRAPGRLSIPQSGFAFFNIEKK